MDPYKYLKDIIQQTEILKSPSRRLATFGQTSIHYFYISEIKNFRDRSRLREGLVVAERPKIITPDFLKNRFEGFNKEAQELGSWLSEKYGTLRGLEYKFRNENSSSHIENSSVKAIAEKIEKNLSREESAHSAIIRGPDQTWQISLMKFAIDECISSFNSNVSELEEHGFFDSPEKTVQDRRKSIESLFERAKRNRSYLSILGKKLHEYGLFKEYEDEFFKLIKNG